MEGGLSRKRGYVVLVALLALTLLALLLWRGCREERTPDVVMDSAVIAELESFEQEQQEKREDRERKHTPPARWATSPNPVSGSTFKGEELAEASKKNYPRKTSRTIDLNTADTAELQQLRGIGPVLSARIVRYRSLLGGFTDKKQLLEVYGLPDSVYRRIAPQLSVDTSRIQRLDINTATYGQLVRHPYLDKHQVAAIVRLRERKGAFASLDDLHQIPIIEQETYNKIIPYLSCNSQPKK
jgi:DNA uptake protein ComE-like DNA-binding protein